MRLSLIGPGDIEFHYQRVLGISLTEFKSQLERIAQAIADSGSEICLLPDRGISLEIAVEYRKRKGRKVTAVIPQSDELIKIEHLRDYINMKVGGKPLFDEMIDSGDWFKHDMTKALFGDAVLYLGRAPGVEVERNGAIYLYKFLERVKIHPEIKAGKSYFLLVYSPFIIGEKLSPEDEAYILRAGISLRYLKNPEQLKKELHRFKL